MTRGKKKNIAVNQGEMVKLMAQMQKCFLGSTIPSLGAPGDFEMMENGNKQELIEKIKQHHKEAWHNYPGKNRGAIESLNQKIEELGATIRHMREGAPSEEGERKEYYRHHNKTNFGHDFVLNIVTALKKETASYVSASLDVQNADGTPRTEAKIEAIFPKFHNPKFMQENQEHSMFKMMHWLKHTKRKAFATIAKHILLNTLPESEFEGNHHGRTKRTGSMEAYIEHWKAANHAIHELHMMRHPQKHTHGKSGGGKKRRKGKGKSKKGRKGKHRASEAQLTPFPIL